MENAETVHKMEKELYVAAVNGNVEFLRAQSKSDNNLRKKTHEKNNIIHIATRHEQHGFINVFLEEFQNNGNVICDINARGDTPLHVAAEVGNLGIVRLLYDYLEKFVLEGRRHEGDKKPWRVPNSEGNTPVHVALIHGNANVAKFLLEKDPELAFITNESKDAPLHLAIKHYANYSESESLMTRVKQPVHGGGADLAINLEVGEDMSSIIYYLVEKGSRVTCWRDANGSTPLHNAASLSTPHNLQVIRSILYHCPQSAEVCDTLGNSILHLLVGKIPSYEEGKNLLNSKEIYALRNYKDLQGNIPLHIAARDKDVNMVRLLFEFSTKINIKNTEGISAASLVLQHNLLEKLRKRNMTREEGEAADRANISYLRDRMSKLGVDFLLSTDANGRNVLHRLMQIQCESCIRKDDIVDFIEQALGSCPVLVRQTDLNGDTPVHILVRNNYETRIHVASGNQDKTQQIIDEFVLSPILKSGLYQMLLELCNNCIIKEASSNRAHEEAPWLIQNAKGNTPLHDALLTKNNRKLVMTLLNFGPGSTMLVNDHKETPLHLLAGYSNSMEPFQREEVQSMVEANVEATSWADQDGLTPLLRAVQAGNLSTATILCTLSPETAKICDPKGHTIWHLLLDHPSDYYVYRLLQNAELRDVLKLKDGNGNTPLHLAIKRKRFDLVKVFLETWEREHEPPKAKDKPSKVEDEPKGNGEPSKDREEQSKGNDESPKGSGDPSTKKEKDEPSKGKDEPSKGKDEPPKGKDEWLLDLLKIQNKAGISPGDLIGESTSLPPDIEKSIGARNEMIGYRSVWGIPTIEIKTYVNTMGVIAALLTTITFTAAFAVPGGVFEDRGTPVLITRAAFQVFMISDVLAMCLSMMVLFCLLWIMATSKRRNSVMILDISIFLLLASFYATLLTFMSGLFAVMFPLRPWIAIVTLVLCILLMLLVLKFIVVKLLIPFAKVAIVVVRRLQQCFARFISNKAAGCQVTTGGHPVDRIV